jgi:hypothetical protein
MEASFIPVESEFNALHICMECRSQPAAQTEADRAIIVFPNYPIRARNDKVQRKITPAIGQRRHVPGASSRVRKRRRHEPSSYAPSAAYPNRGGRSA